MKSINSFSVVFIILAMLLSLSGCSVQQPQSMDKLPQEYNQAPADATYSWMAGESPVPDQRSGILRQGVSSIGKLYEYTDTGVYFITDLDQYLIYGDYGADEFVKLCPRPDCMHNDTSCNAFVLEPLGICLYEEELYLFAVNGLYKMNPDGTDRELVFSIASVGPYTGVSLCGIWNGVITFCLRSYRDGSEVTDAYYFKLDGSMEEAAPCEMYAPFGNHNGSFFGQALNSEGKSGLALWDVESNTITYLCDKVGIDGYYTTQFGIVMQESTVCRYNYGDKSFTPLVDTGLEGTLNLHCFPDCIAISQFLNEEYTMHFYNWAYESLGSVKLNYPIKLWGQNQLICGETEDRIILAATCIGMPEYYIEKSDLGTGNIQIHKYTLPELTEYNRMIASAE